jgi:hypothetical protein
MVAPGFAAGLLVLCHVFSTARLVRQGEEFRIFEGFSDQAARWLYTVAARTDPTSVTEVVVPRGMVTAVVFDAAGAHRALLCAPYDVRTSDALDATEAVAGRSILRAPQPLPHTSGRRWQWLLQACPQGQ